MRLTEASSSFLHFLRAASAQAVVIGHALSFFGVSNRFSIIQNSAVVVFFIISGLVISLTTFAKTEESTSYNFWSYFAERFARIYTGLVPALLVVSLVDLLSINLFGDVYGYGSDFSAGTFIANILMLQDFPFQHLFTSFGSARPLWTVAIEWWVYMFFGWVVLGKYTSERHPWLYWLCLAALSIVPCCNLVGGRGGSLSLMWGMGLIIYFLLQRPQFLGNRTLFVLGCGVFLCAIYRIAMTRDAYDAAYAGLLSIALYSVLRCLQSREKLVRGQSAAIVVGMGNISYMVYLVHYTVLDICVKWFGQGLANMTIGFVASNIVAIAMYFAFDRHHKSVALWLQSLMLRRAG